jgi:Acyl-CoA dehydrogenase, C-terminal domain
MMDADARELFAKTLAQVTAQHDGAALDAALDDLGWRDALADDPQAAVSALFGAQGRSGATSTALDDVLAAALGLDPAPDLAVVLPGLGTWRPPAGATPDGLSVAGLGTDRAGRCDRLVVAVAADAGGDDAATVAVVDASGLDRSAVGGIDPGLGLGAVTGDAAAAGEHTDLAPAAWVDAVAAGRRALAHQLVGTSRTMLEQAREHALERIQFDRPIAQFQAVRHRLAESLVAIEGADAALAAAWDDPTPLGSSVAKALAGRSARTVARHCQQVLAGIGFTTEHPFHRSVGRVYVLDALLGDARTLTRRLGEELLARRTVPAILPL